jgi:hypothetical protein
VIAISLRRLLTLAYSLVSPLHTCEQAAPVATVGAGHQAPRAIRHYQLNIDELIGGLQSVRLA